MLQKKGSFSRVGFLDTWRGLSVVLMVIMHTMYQLEYTWGLRMWVLHAWWYHGVHLFFSSSFFFISGACCRFTRSNAIRGGKALLCGAVVTAATLIATPDAPIYFGVLHCLGALMLIYALIERTPIATLVESAIGLPVFLVLFYFMYLWYSGADSGTWATLIFGMPPMIRMGDYFPIIPYIGVFLAGASFGGIVKGGIMPSPFYDITLPILNFTGKNALPVYMLHLPVVYGLLLIFFGFP